MPQYSSLVMEHFAHPRNVGEIENSDGVGHVGNPVCILPETQILKNKEITEISNLKTGEKVLSHDGKYHEAVKIFERNYEGKVYKIKVQKLSSTTLTPEHHVLAEKSEVVDWYSAEELEKGDLIFYPLAGYTKEVGPEIKKVFWLEYEFYAFPIEEITVKNYKGPVFNLEVDETRSYVSNALVLHNCGDIMEMYIKVKDGIIIDAKFKTFGCLPPDEEIVAAEGGWENITKISNGYDVVNGEGNETKVVEIYERTYKGELLTITPFVSPFNSFSLTPDHPVLAVKRDWLKKSRFSSSKCNWKQIRDEKELLDFTSDYINAKDLSISDYLIFNVNRNVKDNPIYSKELMRLIGYYLAEGYCTAQDSVINFSFNKNETKNIEEVKSLLKKITGKEAKERIRGNVSEVYICSRKLVRFLTNVAGRYARKKKLIKEILVLPFEKQWEMISTYLKGDGNCYRRRKKDSQTYRILTTSRNLAIQVQEILARGGIFASIREIFKKNCVIDGRKLKDSLQYIISYKLNRKHKFVHSTPKYFLVPIRKIERKNFQGKVFNFQVAEEPNSYLVKGFAVHNCGAAIATSSIATELVKGKTIDEALRLTNKAVAEALGGLPPIKMHCSVLAEDALKSAIDDYLRKTTGKGLPDFQPRHENHLHNDKQ